MNKTYAVISAINHELTTTLTEQERKEFAVLRSALETVADSPEFEAGETHVDFCFPNAFITKKVDTFIYEQGLLLDGGPGNNAFVWFASTEDICDENFDDKIFNEDDEFFNDDDVYFDDDNDDGYYNDD